MKNKITKIKEFIDVVPIEYIRYFMNTFFNTGGRKEYKTKITVYNYEEMYNYKTFSLDFVIESDIAIIKNQKIKYDKYLLEKINSFIKKSFCSNNIKFEQTFCFNYNEFFAYQLKVTLELIKK